jgi:hypothetical protein
VVRAVKPPYYMLEATVAVLARRIAVLEAELEKAVERARPGEYRRGYHAGYEAARRGAVRRRDGSSSKRAVANGARLERELLKAGMRGCTHEELSAAGVAFISVEIERLRNRGAAIKEDRLPVSGQKRFVMYRKPDVGRAAVHRDPVGPPSPSQDQPGPDQPAPEGSSPDAEPIPLFDPEPPPARSPYEEDAA